MLMHPNTIVIGDSDRVLGSGEQLFDMSVPIFSRYTRGLVATTGNTAEDSFCPS